MVQRLVIKRGSFGFGQFKLEAIPIYQMSLSWITKGVLEEIRRLSYMFIWLRGKDKKGIPFVNQEQFQKHQRNRGTGAKEHFFLLEGIGIQNYLEANTRKFLMGFSGQRHVREKSTSTESIDGWLRNPTKATNNVSIIWKTMFLAFSQMEIGLTFMWVGEALFRWVWTHGLRVHKFLGYLTFNMLHNMQRLIYFIICIYIYIYN